MVRGLDKFEEYFAGFGDAYIIIGGTACDLTLSDAGLRSRATNDIDIILIAENLSREFIQVFWKFISEGRYNKKERSSVRKNNFRFSDPLQTSFPWQIELFSRKAIFDLPDYNIHITPIPLDEDLSSLSAILMNDDYYNFTIQHSSGLGRLHLADIYSLIILKAAAYIDNKARKSMGQNISSRDVNKHKNDIFRLIPLIPADQNIALPSAIKSDMTEFCRLIQNDLPASSLFKELGAPGLKSEDLFETLKSIFTLSN
ncbi:MAG: hypothetical protein HUU43_04205 [Ignavibacteriaceae bacterium]|nr:hypothetical protein [Ignavibacteriaceae bacterium]